MIHELRIYEIFEHNKQAFHDRFRDHAIRIMTGYGFEFVAIWETARRGRTEFVYLLRWDDEAEKERAWAAFGEDLEWKDIKAATGAEHGDLVGDIEGIVLEHVPYSPRS